MSLKQRINFGENLTTFTERKIAKALELNGMVLPVSIVEREGHMITVQFELINIPFTLPQITVPIFGPQYIRYPMQPGEKGVVIPANAYLGGVSGLGGGTADLTPPLNLSALFFLPISNTEWQEVDYQTLTMYGPQGVILRDSESKCTFILTPTSVAIDAPEKFDVKVGETTISLTQSKWSLSGDSASMIDSAGETSPAIMAAAWSALKTWANSHTHSNGNKGSPTGAPLTKMSGEIVK